MCEIFDEIRQEGEKRGFEQGERYGIEQGEERMLVASLRSLMERLSFTAQEAFDALNVPEAKRPRYLAML